MVADGVGDELAAFLWEEFQPYYFAPLTPYPTDRIYGDMHIDSDDISDIALRFEKRFELWLGSGLVDHSQKIMVAARAMAERKTVGTGRSGWRRVASP